MKQGRQNSNIRRNLMAGLLLLPLTMMAQSQRITGSIVDDKGEPLIGATVSVVGKSNIAAAADLEGKFTIDAPANSILSFSYMGFKTKTVKLKAGQENLKVTMEDDTKQLEEVVVTALGISREAKSLGYARQSINTDGLDDIRDPNLLNSLTGKVSGVNFISNGGPLSSTRVEIRGNNSITGNNQPLYVVDGVPILNDMGETGDMDYGNPASSISPDDIESIEVLKGANASALYGSEAANGVILITTRKAKKKNGLGVSYDFNMQVNYLREYPSYQNIWGTMTGWTAVGRNTGYNIYGFNPNNGYEYDPNVKYGQQIMNWGNLDRRSWGLPMLGFDVIGRNDEARKYSPASNTTSELYEPAVQMTHNVSVDRVYNGGSFRFSYTGIDYNGMMKNFDKMKRHNFSVNANVDPAKWLTFQTAVNYQVEDVDNRGYKGASDRNPLYAIAWMPRDLTIEELTPYKREDGKPIAVGDGSYKNPYWLINECTNGDKKNYFRGNVTAFIKPMAGLTIRLRGSMEHSNRSGWTFVNMYTPYDTDGSYDAFNEESSNYNYEVVGTYDKRWKSGLNLNASAGFSYLDQSWDKTYNKVNQLAAPDIKSLSNNASQLTGWQSHSGKRKEGLFGTASLGYKGVYFDATFRNDWSSTLPKANNSYFYYSTSVSGVLTDMFPKIKSNVLSFAKVRASYARVGNDTGFDKLVDGYSYEGLFRNTMAYYKGDVTRKNPDLKPETTTSAEAGFEVRFLKDRLKLDVTYYDKRTKDQIIETSISYMSGYQRAVINSGEVSNKGWEVSIEAVPLRIGKFEWKTIVNWSKNNNMVESLPEGIDRIQIGSGTNNTRSYVEAGKPYGALYGKDFKKNEKGEYLCNDNGGLKEAEDLQYYGCVQAKWRGGWQNQFRFGRFSASIMIDFQHGGLFYSNSMAQGANNGMTVQSLIGRDEFFYSQFILGESDRERQGYLDAANRVTSADYAEGAIYADWQRNKGVYVPNRVYDSDCDPSHAGQPVKSWVTPRDYWMNNANSVRDFIYDASYIKLREVTISYDCPTKWFDRTPIRSLRLSAVGRNLATIFSNTPKGLDPQATSTTGNGQGFENGFSLPEATMGFDVKVTF